MFDSYSETIELFEGWWHGENCRPLVTKRKPAEGVAKGVTDRYQMNRYWPNDGREPDYEGLVAAWGELLANSECTDNLPSLPHAYGGRGTPMILAAYLGGEVRMAPRTVWIEPVVDDWDDFDIRFDADNQWWQRSIKLVETACEMMAEKYLVWMPDLGDAMTVFSLLRGTERLLYDIMDNKEAVLRARDRFLEVWPRYHKATWDIYQRHYPGDCSVLCWAPGKTYMVQCDFSTMISPAQFRELVVPELECLNGYLDYMVWHLDGPDEIKHLDILLELPYIRAIQWQQGAGVPTAGSWLELLRKIQAAGKSVACYTSSAEETDLVLRELSPRGLWIGQSG